MVELAVSFMVIWLLFSGVYSFGYAFYVYNRLQTAVADAA
jgi:Flp pilus assembly protein TadG